MIIDYELNVSMSKIFLRWYLTFTYKLILEINFIQHKITHELGLISIYTTRKKDKLTKL